MTVVGPGGVTAIVLAGGSGTRMGLARNKVYLRIGGRSVLGRSVATFAASTAVDRIVIVRRAVDAEAVSAVLSEEGLSEEGLSEEGLSEEGRREEAVVGRVTVVDGGATRQQSERRGLAAIGADAELVAIHDGARPFLTHTLLDALVAAARRTGGALPALPLDGDIGSFGLVGDVGVGGPIMRVVDPSTMRRVQTPQVFRTAPLLDAYRAAPADFDGFDTAQVVERFGQLEVEAVPGDPGNLKLTTPTDVARAEVLAGRWRDGRWA